MNNPSPSQSPTQTARMGDIVRLIRQVCLFREQGDAARAERLLGDEVADAVNEYRRMQGAGTLPESELREIFALEERRVADAAILCELLLPRLVGSLPAPAGSGPSPVVRTPSKSRPVALPASAGSPAIPDLLDAMLAAERTGRLPAPATQRES